MAKKFYVDTSVWRDYFEDRKDNLKPLGEFAFQFLKKCKEEKWEIIVSDIINIELKSRFSEQQVKEVFSSFKDEIKNVEATKQQKLEAEKYWEKTNKSIPFNDVLHAIIAKQHNAILITRDYHFEMLSSIVEIKKPEEIIFD